MTKLQSPGPMTEMSSTEETAMNTTQHARTRRPGARQLVALAPLVALLLALATAAALRQASTIRPASRAPAAPALARNGYAPTRLDYREDHRAAAPANSPGSGGYRESHGLDSPSTQAGDTYVPSRMDYREDHRTDATPTTGPSGGDTPVCNGDGAVIGNACDIP